MTVLAFIFNYGTEDLAAVNLRATSNIQLFQPFVASNAFANTSKI
jgi:hypothetical protein